MDSSAAFVLPVTPLLDSPSSSSISPRRRPPKNHAKPVSSTRVRMQTNPPNPEPLDGPTITKALEVGFRNVWIRLMTSGVSQSYEEAIQAFVIASMAAYKAGYSLTALKFELAANETDETYMGRDVRLNEQEKETRLVWIALVYLTLARYNFTSERTPPTVASEWKGSKLEGLVTGLRGLVESVCEAAERGYNLQTWKMELNLKVGETGMTPAQASIRSQWSRIVFATVRILPEELMKRK